jgi:hypothetical protein
MSLLSLTREELARFEGKFSEKLDNIQSDVTEVKQDVKDITGCLRDHDDRIKQLEANDTIAAKIYKTWREWLAVAIALGVLIWNMLHGK